MINSVKNHKYIVAWEEKYSTFMVDLFANAAVNYKNVIGNDLKEYYSFILDTNRVVAYNSEVAQDKLNREHGNYFLEAKNIGTLINNYKRLIKEYRLLSNRISKLDIDSLSNKSFSLLLTEFFDFFIKLVAHYRSTRPEAEIGPIQKIKSILYKYYTADKVDDIIFSITASSKINLIESEKRDWFNLLKKDKISKEDIIEYILKYPSFYINIYSLEKIVISIKKRIRQDRKKITELKKNINTSDNLHKSIIKTQQKIYNKCDNNKSLIRYTNMIQEFGFYRFELKNIWAGTELTFLSLFQKLAERLNTSVFNVFNYYTIDELKNIRSISKKDLADRKKCLAILVKDQKYRILSGKDGLSFLKDCEPSVTLSDFVNGVPGYKGLARGRVQIIYPTHSENYKLFKKGNILVTTFTQPSMVPIMSKAAAIVTCGGGITSHCAIVSRELKIVSVIGVKMATQVLKDGDYIEVDGHKGSIKVLKRAK